MEVLVKDQDGQAITTSLLVAEKFGKDHRHVLEAIRALLTTAENSALTNNQSVSKMFVLSEYDVPVNNGTGVTRKAPMYIMNRDGFSLLAMGFTGKRALKFKLDFIQAFNVMENQVKQITADPSPAFVRRLAIVISDMCTLMQSFESRLDKLEETKADNPAEISASPIAPVTTIHRTNEPAPRTTIADKLSMAISLVRDRLRHKTTDKSMAVKVETPKLPEETPKLPEVSRNTPEDIPRFNTEPYYEVVNGIKYFSIPNYMKFHGIKSPVQPSKLGTCASAFCDIHNMKVRIVKSKQYYPEPVLNELFAYYLQETKELSPVGVGSAKGRITARELQIAELRKQGYKYAEIARKLGISASTATSAIERYNRKVVKCGSTTPATTPDKKQIGQSEND